MMQGSLHGSNTIRVKDNGLRVTGNPQDQTSQGVIDEHDATRLTTCVSFQDRLHRLDHGHGVAIGGEVIVWQGLHLPQTFRALDRWTAEFHEGYFLEKPSQYFNAITALGSFSPRLQKRCVVMMVGRDLELGPIFHREFHAPLALVGVPQAIVKAKLYFLFNVAGKIVWCHPTGVDVERRFPAVGVFVHDLKLDRVPGWTFGGAHQAALSGGADPS